MRYKVTADNKVILNTKDYQKAERRASELWDTQQYSRVVVSDAQTGDHITTYRYRYRYSV